MNFDNFLEKVNNGKYNQANYQLVVICHLSRAKNHTDAQENIAQSLAINNGKESGDYKQFMASCPVWKVLSGKNMIKKSGEFYRLNVSMTTNQADALHKVCKELMK